MRIGLEVFRSKKRQDQSPEIGDDMIVIVDRAVNPYLVLFHEPSGYRAEQVRGLRNKLLAMNPDQASKSLVVTSAIKGEGKTVTAINLAMALAELEHQRVLLIDADLRSPSVELFLNLNPEPGLADVLLGRLPLDSVIVDTGIRNLSVIGAGRRLAGPSEVLATPRIDDLLDALKQRYQYVIIDTPPVLPVTDASVLAARADGTLLTVRLERSLKSMTRDALRNLQDLGANVLGVFVNEVREAATHRNPRFAYDREEEL